MHTPKLKATEIGVQYKYLLHPPLTNLTKHKKGPYINGIKIYNHLPQHIKKLEQNLKHFAVALKRFLYHHSFYSINEYLEYKESK